MAKQIRGMKPLAPKAARTAPNYMKQGDAANALAAQASLLDVLEQPTLTAESAKRIDGVKQTTGIEWTNHTWNPMVGCTIHTAGCTNCYAMKQAGVIQAKHYEGVVKWVGKDPSQRDSVWTGKINKAPPHIMNKPDNIKGEAMIFVNSMSDFFHADMKFEWQAEAMSVMKRNGHHIFQVLTKRPENIVKFVEQARAHTKNPNWKFPYNVWVGATMEREDYTWRIGHLRYLKKNGIAARTFLSIEPLIGPAGTLHLDGIDWVIIGGESGPGSRPMKYEWVKDVIDQCIAQNVPVFFKQWGIKQNNPIWIEGGDAALYAKDKVGKGGSLVDGIAYKDFPTKSSFAEHGA